MDGLRIGQVARRAEVNRQTIHYYERRGLLPLATRTASNYRLYPPEIVRRIRFVKRAQELGFTLREIKGLLALRAVPRSRSAEVRKRALAKANDIRGKIRTLQSMRRALEKLVAECSGKGLVTECPILGSLDGEGRRACRSDE